MSCQYCGNLHYGDESPNTSDRVKSEEFTAVFVSVNQQAEADLEILAFTANLIFGANFLRVSAKC